MTKTRPPIDDSDVKNIAQKGHNVGGVEVPKLKSFIERIESLMEEKKSVGSDITDLFSEAKAQGFDTKAMRTCIKERAMRVNERVEQEYVTDLYRSALGLISTFDDDI